MARAGARGRPAAPLGPARPRSAGVAPHRPAPEAAIRAGRGGLWRLSDYGVARTTWKCVPPPSISSSASNSSCSRTWASLRSVQGSGDGFSSRKGEAAAITCARATANYRANARAAPGLRSLSPLPDHGASKNGPRLPSAGPRWGGVGGAGVAGCGSPSLAPPRGQPMIARDRGPGGYSRWQLSSPFLPRTPSVSGQPRFSGESSQG